VAVPTEKRSASRTPGAPLMGDGLGVTCDVGELLGGVGAYV
jgi:hypothetical protein